MNKTIRILRKLLIYVFILFVLLGLTGYIYLYVLPKGPEVTMVRQLNTGKDSFVIYAHKASKRKSIRVWTYKPEAWNDQDQIVFVMHGGGRNADDYRDAWVELAESQNLLIIAPEFENKFSKYTTNDYQEGNLFTFFGTENPKEEWAYVVIENIFDHIKSVNAITNSHYDIFGHSAGGQFVHRMLMIMPESRIETAIAANSGFYSLPDENLEFPYGLQKTDVTLHPDVQNAYKKRLIILLGALDNDPSLGTFRTTDLAMEQGEHRLERGTHYFMVNKALSQQNNWEFNWQIDTVKQVGHNYREMSKNAIKWLSNPIPKDDIDF